MTTAALWLAGCGAPAAETAGEAVSQNGLYAVTWASETAPVPLNTLHTWTVQIDDGSGRAVEDARVQVDGGMPAHNHGLPTRPQAMQDEGGGYRIEGMQFQMPGQWVITLTVEAGAGLDTVVIPFEVAP